MEVRALVRSSSSPHSEAASTRSTAACLIATTLSAVTYALAFPPTAFRPLAYVALVPFLVALRHSTPPRALALGLVWGVIDTLVVGACLTTAIENYYEQPAWLGWLFLLCVGMVTAVPFYGLFAGAYRLLARRFRSTLPLLTGAAWVAAELGRLVVPPGNPWAIAGYSQIGVLPLMQIAEVAGVHGMTFVVVAVNASLAQVILAASGRAEWRKAAVGVGLTAALATAVVGYGWFRLNDPSLNERPEAGIAIIQGNVALDRVWRREFYGKNLDLYLRLSHEALESSGAQTVFWPESAMTFYVADRPAYRSALRRLLDFHDAELVAGGPRQVGADTHDPSYYNTLFTIAPQGEVTGWYDKEVLLPFAEYYPLGSRVFMRRDFSVGTEMVPGEATRPLDTRAGRAGVLICNEVFFPSVTSRRVRGGAEYLVNPANDSWFGDLQYSLQAFDMARLRAVEQRRYLVRASTAGPSAIIDPLGRIQAKTLPFEKGWIQGRIAPRDDETPYGRVGDLFAWTCLGLTLMGCFWSLGSRSNESQ